MAASAPSVAGTAASARGRLVDRISGLWARRPEWARDRAVLGLAASLLVLLALFFASLSYLGAERPGDQISLDRLDSLLRGGRVSTLELRDQDAVAVGTLRPGGRQFSVTYPSSDAVTAQIVRDGSNNGTRVSVDEQTAKQTVRDIATFLLPLMILANLFALLFVGSRAGGSALRDVETFGTVGKGKRNGVAGSRVTFADVAGADEAVEELQEVVDYLRDPTRYASVGAVPPKGVLLFGPPGCGKTLLARAVAGEAGVSFFSVGGAEFVESLVGVGAARVRDLFMRVREASPAIVFIDELDAAARRRGAGGSSGGGSDGREQTRNPTLLP